MCGHLMIAGRKEDYYPFRAMHEFSFGMTGMRASSDSVETGTSIESVGSSGVVQSSSKRYFCARLACMSICATAMQHHEKVLSSTRDLVWSSLMVRRRIGPTGLVEDTSRPVLP
jgi:hypothetical protein